MSFSCGGELPTRMITFFASCRHFSWRIAHSRPSFTASSQSPPPSATMPSRKACTFFTLKVRSVHLTTKASLCRGAARRALVVVAVAVGDRADARGRHQALHGGGEVVHAALQVVDHALHAAGRVDDDRDVEPDLSEAAHVSPEGGAERPA